VQPHQRTSDNPTAQRQYSNILPAPIFPPIRSPRERYFNDSLTASSPYPLSYEHHQNKLFGEPSQGGRASKSPNNASPRDHDPRYSLPSHTIPDRPGISHSGAPPQERERNLDAPAESSTSPMDISRPMDVKPPDHNDTRPYSAEEDWESQSRMRRSFSSSQRKDRFNDVHQLHIQPESPSSLSLVTPQDERDHALVGKTKCSTSQEEEAARHTANIKDDPLEPQSPYSLAALNRYIQNQGPSTRPQTGISEVTDGNTGTYAHSCCFCSCSLLLPPMHTFLIQFKSLNIPALHSQPHPFTHTSTLLILNAYVPEVCSLPNTSVNMGRSIGHTY